MSEDSALAFSKTDAIREMEMTAYQKPDMAIEATLAPTKIALLEEELAECKVWSNAGYEALGTQIKKIAELEDCIEATRDVVADQLKRIAELEAEIAKYQLAIYKQEERCEALKQGWLECQARIEQYEKDVRVKSLKAAKREALLEAAEYVGRNLYDNKTYSEELRHMAEELK